MDFRSIDNLNEEQILDLYKDVIEAPPKLTYQPCWDGTEGPCK